MTKKEMKERFIYNLKDNARMIKEFQQEYKDSDYTNKGSKRLFLNLLFLNQEIICMMQVNFKLIKTKEAADLLNLYYFDLM